MIYEKNVTDNYIEMKPEGRIDMAVAKEFEKIALSLMAKEPPTVIINFEKTAYISSAGLRVILTATKEAKSKNKKLYICGVNASIRKVLDKSGFTSFLEIFDSINDIFD